MTVLAEPRVAPTAPAPEGRSVERRTVVEPAVPTVDVVRETLSVVVVLSKKNFRIRYKRAALGAVWAVLQPAVQAGVLAFIFSRVVDIGKPEHYTAYVLSGVLGWAFFSQSLSVVTTSVVDNESLVKKVALPPVVYPTAALGGVAMAAAYALPVLLVASLAGGTASWRLVFLPVPFALAGLVSLAFGIFTSGLYPAFRDVKYLVESVLLVGIYATPVLYDPSRLHGALPVVLRCNPMTGVLELYRWTVIGSPVDPIALIVSLGVIAVLPAVGFLAFRKRADEFADLL